VARRRGGGYVCGGRSRRCPGCRSRNTTHTGDWAWCGACGACFSHEPKSKKAVATKISGAK